MQRVQKIIAESGFCSRRKAEELIESGKVSVNGKIVRLGDQANANDDIRIGSKRIFLPKKVYLMLNKPRGYITTNSDIYGRKKVTDLVRDIGVRVFSVGRLDRDATGLLLMTNDGDWANDIMHPRNAVDKEYHVQLDKPVDKKTIAEMNNGIRLRDGPVNARIRRISKDYCSITLHEGRNKIVKRVFSKFGFKVVNLKRVRIGKYRLSNLKPGRWKVISP